MTENLTDSEAEDFFDPTANGQREEPLFDESEAGATYTNYDYDALIDAPDYSTLVKGTRSRTAREYELKVKSILKAGAMGSLRHGNLPDAATFFRHGPALSAAAGDMADVSDQTRRAIDMLTAPDNPYVMFAVAALPMIAQLWRNHQPQIEQLQATRRQMRKYRKEHPEEFQRPEDKRKNVELTLPFGRKVSFRVGLKRNPLKGLRFAIHTQTRDPGELVTMVFSDEKLVAALRKQGITFVQTKMPS